MPLIDTAIADLANIIHDENSGGKTCRIISPSGDYEDFMVMSNDIHLVLDPITGNLISGRQSSIAVLISDLYTAGFASICNVPDDDQQPWIVKLTNSRGVENTFKVSSSNPDNGIGLNTLFLESVTEQS